MSTETPKSRSTGADGAARPVPALATSMPAATTAVSTAPALATSTPAATTAVSTAPALATSTPAATTAMSTTDRRPGAFAPKRTAPVATNVSGRVRHDDRGNAVWEWALTSGAFAADSAQRLKKLNHPLSLAEDAPTPSDTVKSNPLGTVKGYSPYDSGVLAKGEARRKKDLRKLSEWLKLRKQASNNDPYKE